MVEKLRAFWEWVLSLFQRPEFTSEALKGTPAVVATAWTLNEWVAVATIAYIVLQAAYLARKWWREERGKK